MRLLIILLLLSILSLIFCNNNNPPSQIHIALAGDDGHGNSNRMSISWQTTTQTKTSTVKYGENSGQYTFSSVGFSSTYYETFDNHVKTNILKPNTKYYYIVGDEDGGYSTEFSFVSAPTADLRSNFSFSVFADMGVVNGKWSNDYLTQIKDSINFVWHGGDVGYADDSFLHFDCYLKFCYEKTFNEYMSNIETWASQLPYMVAVGNHEADCHDPNCMAHKERKEKLSNFTAFNSRFQMPSEESQGVMNMHYSFNYGNIHMITIDSETGYPGAAEETKYVYPCGGFGGGKYKDQLEWLEADLIKANSERSIRPWIFAQGHHPLYQGASINKEYQAAVEDLFYKYGVDIYFSGHVHSYERDWPVYQGIPEKTYTNPKATTYLMIGGSGNDEMKSAKRKLFLAGAEKLIERIGDFMTPKNGQLGSTWKESDDNGPWTVVTDVDDHVGIGKVTIIDDNNLKFEYIRTATGEVYDSFTLTRDHSVYVN